MSEVTKKTSPQPRCGSPGRLLICAFDLFLKNCYWEMEVVECSREGGRKEGPSQVSPTFTIQTRRISSTSTQRSQVSARWPLGCCSVLSREIYSEELSEKEPANTPHSGRVWGRVYNTRAGNKPSRVWSFTITEKAPTMTLSWLKTASAFTFKKYTIKILMLNGR